MFVCSRGSWGKTSFIYYQNIYYYYYICWFDRQNVFIKIHRHFHPESTHVQK